MLRVFLIFAAAIVWGEAVADDAKPAPIAVFPFELEDKSAGAGIIAPDEHDKRYLVESAVEAKQLLGATGRFAVTDGRAKEADAPYGLRNCDGCEAKLAREQGAHFAMLGVVTRVNRTEHTMRIRVTDARTGEVVSQGFTNLRMGANYAWPRSVKWLMDNQVLAAAKR